MVDPLHPNGRCTCCGEGRCEWCLNTRNPTDAEEAMLEAAEALREIVRLRLDPVAFIETIIGIKLSAEQAELVLRGLASDE